MFNPTTLEFLEQPLPIVLGTRRRNGRVKLNPVWFEWRDDHFWLNGWRGAHWLDHVEREKEASLLLVDPADPHRTVHAEANLVRTTSVGAGEHLDRLSHRYLGGPYRGRGPTSRVIVELAPVRVLSTLGARAVG